MGWVDRAGPFFNHKAHSHFSMSEETTSLTETHGTTKVQNWGMEQKQSHWKTSSFQPSRQPSSAQHRWCGACIWVELWCTLSSALKQKQWHLSPPYLWAHTGPTMKSLCTLHDLLVVGQALRGMETEKTCSLPPGNPKSHREDRQVPRDGHRVLCDENNNEESGSGCSCLCRWSWGGGMWEEPPHPTPARLPQVLRIPGWPLELKRSFKRSSGFVHFSVQVSPDG